MFVYLIPLHQEQKNGSSFRGFLFPNKTTAADACEIITCICGGWFLG